MPTKSQEKIILDAWALLAFIFGEEPAAGMVKEILEQKETCKSSIYISWINIGEVYYTIARRKGVDVAKEILQDIKRLSVTLHEPLKADILAAAEIKSKFRLSYADAFAVSLAHKIGGMVVTGDPEIIQLKDIVKVKRLTRTET